jgi:hypothetical protein
MIRKYIPHAYFLSMALVVCGLSTSMFLMSIGSIGMFFTWIADGNFKNKFISLKTDKRILWMVAFYMVHVFALLYTSNFDYAFKDLRIKLPLLLFPVILGTMPVLKKKQIDLLFILFIAAVTFSTFYSYLVYRDIISIDRDVNDARTISRFISHIRLSMNICMSVLLLFFYFKHKSLKITSLKILLVFWFLYFLFILESATGYLILFSCTLAACGYYAVLAEKAFSRVVAVSFLGFIFISACLFFYIIVTNYYQPRDLDISNLDKRTKYGEIYQHDTTNLQLENGYYIWMYIAQVEMEEAWNKRSEYAYTSLDKKGQPVKWTLIRYMTSKGLRKDRDGVGALSDADVKNIENGITSVDANSSSGLVKRIKVILYEFDSYFRGITPNGNSVTQRFEYWRVGWSLFKENIFSGVGTGDVNDEYRKQYRRVKSELIFKYRNRAHNQFLTVCISFGIIGFIVFVVSLFIPFYKTKLAREIVYILFFTLLLVSMMGEDTLETQAGVTFAAFFTSFLVFHCFRKNTEDKT